MTPDHVLDTVTERLAAELGLVVLDAPELLQDAGGELPPARTLDTLTHHRRLIMSETAQDQTTIININHDDWIVCDRSGYTQQHGVEVRRCGDGTIRVGNTLHREDELEVISDRLIKSLGAGWTLER